MYDGVGAAIVDQQLIFRCFRSIESFSFHFFVLCSNALPSTQNEIGRKVKIDQ